MVNSETTLQEFIQYIPLLNKDCPLQRVVSTIYSSSQRMIALVHDDGTPKGIIYSYLLLESIKEKVSKKDYSEVTEISLSKASIPLIALTCKTKVRDFLDYFILNKEQRDYWIVNEEGKLLGIINIPKLLQVLCFEQTWRENEPSKELNKISLSTVSKVLESNIKVAYSYSDKQKALSRKHISHRGVVTSSKKTEFTAIETQKQLELKRLNDNFYSLLNECSFPLAIENERGDILYQNKYWHEKILTKPKLFEPKAKRYDAEWRLELDKKALDCQRTELNLKNNNYQKITKNKNCDYCHTAIADINRVYNSQLQQQIKLLKFNPSDCSSQTKLLKIKEASTKIFEESSGNYYRVPLRINKDKIEISELPNYWLRFATKFPLSKDNSFSNSHNKNKIAQTKLKQLRDELILNVTHDIKSPLTAIIGLSSLLKETKIDHTQNNQLRYSQMIYKSGKKLIDLINDFLNITRLTTENFELNLECIEIENLCEKIYFQAQEKLKAVATTLQNDAISFPKLQFDIDSDVMAIADKACLVQIVSCFVENALELAKPESTIGIKAEYWSDWLAITVSNQGKGLSEAEQDFSATKLSQDNNLLTSHEKNRKLGLMLAQHLAQTHGGDISLISQANYGNQFTLLLPKSDRQKNESMIDSDSESKTNCLVLIVETSSTRIFKLSDRLKALGYQCAIAKNQEDALYKACCLKPYKIILNSCFIKPNQDIVKTFKSNSATYNIPIIVVTDDFPEEKAQNQDFKSFSTNQHYLDTLDEVVEEFISFPCNEAALTNLFTPLSSGNPSVEKSLTVLRLCLTEKKTQETQNSPSDFIFENPSFNLSHHIIEADSIEQADLLATIWNIDVIIWDSINLDSPQHHLKSLAEFDSLAEIPLITLDTQSTEIANKITNLTVFPCLLPANKRSIKQLSQVIQIAAGCTRKIL